MWPTLLYCYDEYKLWLETSDWHLNFARKKKQYILVQFLIFNDLTQICKNTLNAFKITIRYKAVANHSVIFPKVTTILCLKYQLF